MDDVTAYIRKNVIDVALAAAMLSGTFAGLFGAANWNSHVSPDPPQRGRLTNELEYEARLADHQRKVENIGREAVIPFVWALPLTLTGFAAAGFCVVVLIARHAE